MKNTPQRVCESSSGTWDANAQCDIPQCRLGCCIVGDQGAFVTLTRCKEISGFYSLKTDFRPAIQNELSCIATAQGQEKGACVVEDPSTLSKTCTFTTRDQCKVGGMDGTVIDATINQSIASVGFYSGVLCSAEQLGSICGPTSTTTIIDGKDEVYYLDSCGNLANIYDSNKYNDKNYWAKPYSKSESCGATVSNAKSKTCGNCDYALGSIGKKVTTTLGKPVQGDYICADLSCSAIGKKHGESWCVTDSPSGNGLDTVGSRYFKQVCLFDEIITEPCADYRGEVCLQGNFNGYTEAACRVNRWQDCLSQLEQSDCENKDVRDCIWEPGYYYSSNEKQLQKTNNNSAQGPITPKGVCLPFYPPGSNFWSSSTANSFSSLSSTTSTTNSGTPAFGSTTSAFGAKTSSFGTGYVTPTTQTSNTCSIGSSKLTISWTMEKRMWPFNDEAWACANDACNLYDKDPAVAEITDQEAQAWADDMNSICYKLGDCGGYINWQGQYTEDGYAAYVDYERVAGSGGSEIQEQPKAATTGKVVADMLKGMFGK